MHKCYCVRYVGDDSLDHDKIVLAADPDAAAAKVRVAMDADIITDVRQVANPFVALAIVLVVLAAVILQLVR